MKKCIVVAVIVTLIGALGLVGNYALEDKGVRATKKKIKLLRIVEEEQRLLKEYWQHRVEIARIQLMFKDPNDS